MTGTPIARLVPVADDPDEKSKRDVPDAWREGVAVALAATIKRKGLEGKNTREQAEALGLKQPTFNQLMNRKGSLGIHVLVQVREATGYSIDEMLQLRATTEASARRAKNREALDEIRKRLDALHALLSISGPLSRESRSAMKKLVVEAQADRNSLGGDIAREEIAEKERDERLRLLEERRRAG